jgi:hypothetical protein
MIPNINVYSVDSKNIILVWKSQDKDTVKSWNLYGCATATGSYALVEGYIPNMAHPMSPGSCMAKVSRQALSLGSDAPYFFKLTSVDMSGTESNIASSAYVSVDALDDVFRNRFTDDNSPVYSSKSVSLNHTVTNQLFDVVQILGRQANYIRVLTSHDVSIKLNSQSNDSILVSSNSPFIPDRQSIAVSSIYLSTVNGNATVQIFVSGN